MRVGVDVRELQQGVRTGIGRFVESFVSEAPGLRPDLKLFLYGDANTRLDLEKGLPGKDLGDAPRVQQRVLCQPTTLWFDQLALPLALARDRIDVFLSPYYKAPLSSPCPTVVTLHDVLFLKVGYHRLKNVFFGPWSRLIASQAAAVLTDSEYSRRDLENVLGLRTARIEVVPLGVSPHFSPSASRGAATLARRLGLPNHYLLSVTNFRPHKNDALLIRAFAGVAAHVPDLALVLAGRGAKSAEKLRRLVERLQLKDKVVFTGVIPEEDLPALYAGARVFALPSLYEGFGLPVLEAMASGVPVLCSNTSALPEVAGEGAVLLDPEDEGAWQQGLRRLLRDEPFRRRLIEAGLERARHFTWEKAASRILKVLEEAS